MGMCMHSQCFVKYMMHFFVHMLYINPIVHAASSVDIKDESNQDFDTSPGVLDCVIDVNSWSDVDMSALTHDACFDHDIER